MGFWAQLTEQIKQMWAGFTAVQKTTLVAVSSIAIIFTFYFVWLAQQPNYEPLFTDLDPKTASAYTTKLKEMDVPVKLADEGQTIMVPSEKKYQLRIDLAGQVDAPGSVVGYEIFNTTKFGETDTDKRMKFLMALQGELTRTIEVIDEVDSARVLIALPQTSLFIKDQQEPTASVMLKLKPYANLKPEQIKAIMSLVSHSVERLKPQNVSVMDGNGNDLSEDLAETAFSPNTAKFSANQVALKQQFESDLARSVQSMLEKTRGPGKAVVRANVELDFDQVERHSEIYGDAVLTSEHSKEETSSGTSSEGANPADSNMGGPSYGSTGAGTSEKSSVERTRNYEVSKTVETKIVAPGKVTKVSMSVLIDGELSPQDQEKIVDAVSKAAGIDTARGDQVSIVGMPFNNAEQERMRQEMAKAEADKQRNEYIKIGLVALAVLGSLGLLFFLLRKFQPGLRQAGISPMRAELATAGEGQMNIEIPPLSPEITDKQRMKIQVDKLATTNPEEVAKVIKTWLVEE